MIATAATCWAAVSTSIMRPKVNIFEIEVVVC
jgi:hypothetical protein